MTGAICFFGFTVLVIAAFALVIRAFGGIGEGNSNSQEAG